jgi:hypothetical protein
MLAKQMKKATPVREAKGSGAELWDALYIIPGRTI